MRRTLLVLSTLLGSLGVASLLPAADDAKKPIRVLIVTGDHGHKWQETTPALEKILRPDFDVATTVTPATDLTDENLAKFDVLLLNYRDTDKGAPETKWSPANKEAFLNALKAGKGLVVFHHASSAFVNPNWTEFEKATAGGWRKQGFHGPAHEFKVKTTDAKHPISQGLPAEFDHVIDELYQNSLVTPGSTVLATAYSDPAKPKGTGKDEPVVWVNQYGKGRVVQISLGHDTKAIADPHLHTWLRRATEWAATGAVKASAGN